VRDAAVSAVKKQNSISGVGCTENILNCGWRGQALRNSARCPVDRRYGCNLPNDVTCMWFSYAERRAAALTA